MMTVDAKFQYNLSGLVVLVTVASVFMASIHWTFRSSALGTPEDMSFLYIIGFPLMEVGLFVSPFVCVISIIGFVVLGIRNFPSTISNWMFLGYAGIATIEITLPSLHWLDSANRILALVVVSSMACVVETSLRHWSPSRIITTVFSIVFALAYYIYVASVAACIAA